MRLIIAFLLSTLAATVQAGYAYSDHYESFGELEAKATLIITGTVKKRLKAHSVERVYKKKPVTESKRAPLMTPFIISIEEVVKGKRKGAQIRVMQVGGETSEYEHSIFGAPLLEEGQTVLLFLEPHVNGRGKETGQFVIVGLNDGVFLTGGNEVSKLEGSENGTSLTDIALDEVIANIGD